MELAIHGWIANKMVYMDWRYLFTGCICIIFILCVVCISIICYFRKREQRVLSRLQKMLDEAVSGTFEDSHLDETKLSAIESSMWRYLCDNELSYLRVSGQKEHIQALISDISHQTMTVVSNILLYSQLLEEGYLAEEQGNDQEFMGKIGAIQEQAGKLDFFIQSLVKLSYLEKGMITVNPKQQSIGTVLSALKRQFLLKAAQKRIRFEVADSSETAAFDWKWTLEAVANIIDNAIKYTPCGGKVFVNVECYTIFLRINIMDTGIGISEAEQGSIFTRFYRSAAVEEKQGVGIGLYLAREIIKAQNGYIKITSEVGKGSTFSVFLLRNISDRGNCHKSDIFQKQV